LLKTAGRVRTERGKGTAEAVGTIIKRASETAGFLEDEVATDFFGDGGAIPS